MRYRKPTHPVTADHRREIDIGSLARHGAFRRPMRFPFQGIESARDHIRLFSPGNRQRPPQIIAVQWRQMTFGWKPFFICPRCRTRRAFLYFDTLEAYCRNCAGLWFRSQQVRRRTRLLRRSHRIRASLGDQTGKPGDPFPATGKRNQDVPRMVKKRRHGRRAVMTTFQSPSADVSYWRKSDNTCRKPGIDCCSA